MVNDLITMLFYVFGKLLNFLFNSYILDGVSLGMLFVVSFMFTIMLRFLVAIPVMGGAKHVEKGTDSTGSSSSKH